MLRITAGTATPAAVVLLIEGEITEETIEVVEGEFEQWRKRRAELVVDLAGVRVVDPAGLSLLEAWSGEGLVLRNASRYIRALLGKHGLQVEN